MPPFRFIGTNANFFDVLPFYNPTTLKEMLLEVCGREGIGDSAALYQVDTKQRNGDEQANREQRFSQLGDRNRSKALTIANTTTSPLTKTELAS